jgi:hypothetical protein
MNGRTDGRGHWKQDKQKYFSQNPTSKTHRNYSALTKQPVRNYLDGSADIASTDTIITYFIQISITARYAGHATWKKKKRATYLPSALALPP